MSGKMSQKGFSAVGFLFSDSLLGVPETIMAQSHLASRQGQDSERTLSKYEIIDAVPAVRMLRLDSVFRPPYSIEPVSE